VTISTPGKIERTPSRAPGLRDLTSATVRDHIVAKAREDANATLIRKLRVQRRAQLS
jgi:hypothetical protein